MPKRGRRRGGGAGGGGGGRHEEQGDRRGGERKGRTGKQIGQREKGVGGEGGGEGGGRQEERQKRGEKEGRGGGGRRGGEGGGGGGGGWDDLIRPGLPPTFIVYGDVDRTVDPTQDTPTQEGPRRRRRSQRHSPDRRVAGTAASRLRRRHSQAPLPRVPAGAGHPALATIQLTPG